MQVGIVKIGLKRMAVGICAFGLVCLGTPIGAGTDSGTAAYNTTAGLRLIIHIPETLSMRIAEPERSGRFAVLGKNAGNRSGKSNENQQTIQIEILGNVATGGTMALTTHKAVPQQDGQIKREPRSLVTWTAKGFYPAENPPGSDAGSGIAGSPAPHTFLFNNRHPYGPGRIDEQLIYTVSAP